MSLDTQGQAVTPNHPMDNRESTDPPFRYQHDRRSTHMCHGQVTEQLVQSISTKITKTTKAPPPTKALEGVREMTNVDGQPQHYLLPSGSTLK